MRKIKRTKKQEATIRVNLMMGTHKKIVKVNIIDSCEWCYFCKKKKGKWYCTCWEYDRQIKHPKGPIKEEHCCLFDYKSMPLHKGKLMGKVFSSL